MHSLILRLTNLFGCALAVLLLTQTAAMQNVVVQTAVAQNPRNQRLPVRIADKRRNAPPQNVGPRGPVSQREAEYIDKILNFWQFSSDKIKHYSCEFRRWEYDSVYGPANEAKTIADGVLKYEKPDKGLYKVEKMWHFTLPAKPGGMPQFLQRPGDVGEHWVCDGESIYQFNTKDKKIVQTILPPEMRGKAISNGPLPFMFGAKAEEMKRRYWLYVTTPKDSKGEYWLLAYPKTREDAANFKMVEIILDEKDFLPKAIQIFGRNYNPPKNQSRSVFTFDKREINPFLNNLQKYSIFHREFYKPATPRGWKKVIINPQAAAPLRNGPPAGNRSSDQSRRGGSYPFRR